MHVGILNTQTKLKPDTMALHLYYSYNGMS